MLNLGLFFICFSVLFIALKIDSTYTGHFKNAISGEIDATMFVANCSVKEIRNFFTSPNSCIFIKEYKICTSPNI